jgi:signal transduction histidine kinase
MILLVTADPSFARAIISQLSGNGHNFQLPIAVSLAQARAQLQSFADAYPRERPCAILLDETATDESQWAAGVHELARTAPLVVVCATKRLEMLLHPALNANEELATSRSEQRVSLLALLAAGSLDWLPRDDCSAKLAAALLRRHARREAHSAAPLPAPLPPAVIEFDGEEREFAELLRHEVNNPLTGILGNAELLLARRARLPEAMVARLETIAELAVRLRETVRRISAACEPAAPRLRPPAAAGSKSRPRLVR